MECSESSSKREVHSNTILPQETRKILNRQPNFTPKTNGKKRTKKNQKLVKGKKDQSRNKTKEIKEKIVKINKTTSWFFEKIKLTNR